MYDKNYFFNKLFDIAKQLSEDDASSNHVNISSKKREKNTQAHDISSSLVDDIKKIRPSSEEYKQPINKTKNNDGIQEMFNQEQKSIGKFKYGRPQKQECHKMPVHVYDEDNAMIDESDLSSMLKDSCDRSNAGTKDEKELLNNFLELSKCFCKQGKFNISKSAYYAYRIIKNFLSKCGNLFVSEAKYLNDLFFLLKEEKNHEIADKIRCHLNKKYLLNLEIQNSFYDDWYMDVAVIAGNKDQTLNKMYALNSKSEKVLSIILESKDLSLIALMLQNANAPVGIQEKAYFDYKHQLNDFFESIMNNPGISGKIKEDIASSMEDDFLESYLLDRTYSEKFVEISKKLCINGMFASSFFSFAISTLLESLDKEKQIQEASCSDILESIEFESNITKYYKTIAKCIFSEKNEIAIAEQLNALYVYLNTILELNAVGAHADCENWKGIMESSSELKNFENYIRNNIETDLFIYIGNAIGNDFIAYFIGISNNISNSMKNRCNSNSELIPDAVKYPIFFDNETESNQEIVLDIENNTEAEEKLKLYENGYDVYTCDTSGNMSSFKAFNIMQSKNKNSFKCKILFNEGNDFIETVYNRKDFEKIGEYLFISHNDALNYVKSVMKFDEVKNESI